MYLSRQLFEEVALSEELVEFRNLGQRAPAARSISNWNEGGSPLHRASGRSTSDASLGFELHRSEEDPTWVGSRLRHPEYGLGTVIQEEGSLDARKVTVEFAGRERRKFLARFVAKFRVG